MCAIVIIKDRIRLVGICMAREESGRCGNIVCGWIRREKDGYTGTEKVI